MTDKRRPRVTTVLPDSDRSKVSIELLRRTATVSFIGASVDSYDFFIYGTASALVFPKAFFPETSPLTGILLSFASFGVGFAARPIGGILFGHIGDARGRKFALVLCLIGMAICTTLMGVLPTYASIGAWSGVALIVLRLVQGVFFGGEAGGALMLLGEVAPAKDRGMYGAIALAGAPGGIIIANGAFFVVSTVMSSQGFEAWGWRIPFLASVVLIGISLYANMRLEESPSFKQFDRSSSSDRGLILETSTKVIEPPSAEKEYSSPVILAIARYWKEILLGAGAYAALNVTFYVIATFGVHYVTKPSIGMSKNTVLGALLIASAVMLAWSIIAGHLSDRHGRHGLMLFGSGAFVVWSFVMWPLLSTGSFWWVLLAFVVGLGIFAGTLSGAYGSLVMELFPTAARFSGVSLSVQLASVLAGAFAPLIAAALFGAYHSTVPIAAFVAGWCLVTVVCVTVLKLIRSTPQEM